MRPRRRDRCRGALETWLWTGPAGHLLGGTLDLAQALARYRARAARAAAAPR